MLTAKETIVLFETKLAQLEARSKVAFNSWEAACDAKQEAEKAKRELEEEDEINTIMIAALRAALEKYKRERKPEHKPKKRRRK